MCECFFFLGVSRPVDAFYLIDASSGVTKESLETIQRFILQQGFINSISSHGARISLISYGDAPRALLSLDQGTDPSLLNSAVANLIPLGGARRIDLALERVKAIIESKRDGSRQHAGKVVAMLVSGNMDPAIRRAVEAQAKALRSMGVKFAVVGIGPHIEEKNLQALDGTDEGYVIVPSAERVYDATPLISSIVGKSVRLPFKLDLGFIVGASGPNAERDFALARQMILSILTRIEVGPDETQVGLIVYGSDVGVVLRLNTVQDRSSAASIVKRLRVTSQGPHLGRAIDLGRQDLFNENYESRKGSPKLALIFTNQDMDGSAESAAKKLIASGINAIFVVFGDGVFSIKGVQSYNIKNSDEALAGSNAIITSILPGRVFPFIKYQSFLHFYSRSLMFKQMCEDVFQRNIPKRHRGFLSESSNFLLIEIFSNLDLANTCNKV